MILTQAFSDTGAILQPVGSRLIYFSKKYINNKAIFVSNYTGYEGLLSQRYARPIETISNTGWSASTGTDLPAMINEETPDDNNYIYSTTYAAVYEGKLEPVEDPGTSINQVIKYRTRSLYGNTLIAKLKQGSTVIATRTHTNVPSEWTQYSMVLTEAEANSITDYTDLRVHTEIG